MLPSLEVEFKTLLTKEEYTRLMNRFKGNPIDVQTNHYLDTERFSLKATDTSLLIRERDTLELTFKRKKGYTMHDIREPLESNQLQIIRETGVLPEGKIFEEVEAIIGKQKLTNFMSLSTERMYFQYGNGVVFIDKSNYLDETDYELEYEARNYHDGKKEFIALLGDFKIKYKKSEKKIKRAYNALKRLM